MANEFDYGGGQEEYMTPVTPPEDPTMMSQEVMSYEPAQVEDTREAFTPDVIPFVLPDILKNTDYETAAKELENLYTGTKWSDPFKASENVAKAYETLNRYHDKNPEFELDTDIAPLMTLLTDSSLDKDTKLTGIEEWRDKTNGALAESTDPAKLFTAIRAKKLTDSYADQLRRHVVSGDTGMILDGMARGANAALAPLAGAADLALGTELSKSVKSLASDYTNPAFDESVSGIASGVVGNIAGFTGSALGGGVGVLGYAGAVLANQAKDVYETAYEETGSEDAAWEATLKAAPFQTLEMFGDRILGGQLAKSAGKLGSRLIKGSAASVDEVAEGTAKALADATKQAAKPMLGDKAVRGGLIEAAGETLSTYGTGEALASATGNEELKATDKQLLISAVAGLGAGAAVGGITDLAEFTDRYLVETALRAQVRAAMTKQDPNKISAEQFIEAELGFTAADNFFSAFVQTEEDMKQAETFPTDNEQDGLIERETQAVAEADISAPANVVEDRIDGQDTEVPDALGKSTPDEVATSNIEETTQTISPSIGPGVKLFSAPPTGYTPLPFMSAITRAMGTYVGMMNAKSTLGMHITKTMKGGGLQSSVIMLNRRIFRNQEQAASTFAHEIGHMIDIYAQDQVNQGRVALGKPRNALMPKDMTVADKLLGLRNATVANLNTEQANLEARNLSAQWRSGWEGAPEYDPSSGNPNNAYIEYRNRPQEIQADVMSAVINNPTYVQANFPEVWKAFEAGLANQPIVKAFWDEVVDMQTNPERIVKYLERERAIGREREKEIYTKNAEDMLAKDNPGLKARLGAIKKDVAIRYYNRFYPAKLVLEGSEDTPENRKIASDYNSLQTAINANDKIQKEIDAATNVVLEEYKQSSIPSVSTATPSQMAFVRSIDEKGLENATPEEKLQYQTIIAKTNDRLGELKNYLRDNKIENETTETQEDIKENRQKYYEALQEINTLIRGYNSQPEKVSKKTGKVTRQKPNPIQAIPADLVAETRKAVTSEDPRDMVDASAAIFGEMNDTDRINFRRYLATQQRLLEKTLIQIEEAAEASDGDTEFPTEELEARINNISNLLILTDPATYSTRRYVANPDGDPKTAKLLLELQKQRLGPENYKLMTGYAKKLFDVWNNGMVPALREAGKLSPEMDRRFDLNRYNWVTFNALQYYEKDPNIPASIKAATGNIDRMGDELAATIMKVKAIRASADYQISQNASVNIASYAPGILVKEIEPKVVRVPKPDGTMYRSTENIFDLRHKLKRENPENSYQIRYEDGVPTLFEINSPDYDKMFSSPTLAMSPSGQALLNAVDAATNLFARKGLLTVFSAPFIIRQLYIDRAKERIAGKSWWPAIPFLPVHLDPKLRRIDKRGKYLANEYMATNPDPVLDFLIDENVLSFGIHKDYFGDSHLVPAEETVYNMMGTPIPGSKKLGLPEKINNKTIKVLEKLGFGKLRARAERDEVRAKINMFYIAKEIYGMNNEMAAAFAREHGGTPDPKAGGTEATQVNKVWMFGRVMFNGQRDMYNMMKRDPRNYAFQAIYRNVLPRLMLSGTIAGAIIGAIFGEEEGKKAKKWLDMVPSYEKNTMSLIPLGFIDDTGKFRTYNSVRADEINDTWKPARFATPFSREMANVNRALSGFYEQAENLVDGGHIDVTRLATETVKGIRDAFGAQLAPGVQTAWHLADIGFGENPQDFFRDKGILTKDVHEHGTLIKKLYDYSLWSLNNYAPWLFSFDHGQSSKKIEEPLDPIHEIARSLPLVGDTTATAIDLTEEVPVYGDMFKQVAKSFFRTSNFGLFERNEGMARKKDEMKSAVREQMGPDTQRLYNEYSRDAGIVTSQGGYKELQKTMTPRQFNRMAAIRKWHSDSYNKGMSAMAESYQKGDEDFLRQAELLEISSSRVLKNLP